MLALAHPILLRLLSKKEKFNQNSHNPTRVHSRIVAAVKIDSHHLELSAVKRALRLITTSVRPFHSPPFRREIILIHGPNWHVRSGSAVFARRNSPAMKVPFVPHND